MDQEEDPFQALRPEGPTPEEDLCRCDDAAPIVLQPHLSPNPLSCLVCNLEVPPDRVGLSKSLARRIAGWQRFHDCFYLLWLDSGEYEDWARMQFEDPGSPVNLRGMKLVSELNRHRRSYYWWFVDKGAGPRSRASQCPVCQGSLAEQHGKGLCERCSIVAAK